MSNICQIYHTSHCGSTLMSTLLRFSSEVYSEPPWLPTLSKKELSKILDERSDCIIKFPSIYCFFSNYYPGKKVFLYRNLKQHLVKILSLEKKRIDKIVSQVDWYGNECLHPLVKKHSLETGIKKITAMWVSRILYLMEVEDVMWIKSNDFFANKKEIMNNVCEHFNAPKVEDFSIAEFYVKEVGFKPGIEVPLSDIIPDTKDKKPIDSSFGIIGNDCDVNIEIETIISWVRVNFPSIPYSLL
jgi:hypothetical protein